MIVTFASGKGGTGKTTIATNLAATLDKMGRPVQLLDCDVEEPNCHLFLKPDIQQETVVTVPVPVVDEDRCSNCGACADFCQFGAILQLGDRILVLPELCLSCGGCGRVCVDEAISERPKEVGVVREGQAGGIAFAEGRLKVGVARAIPIITRVKEGMGRDVTVLVDAPPGTSCPMLESVKDADFVCLVAEPTPFGLNDLEIAVGGVRQLDLPLGIVINRADMGDDRVKRFCAAEEIEILAELPNDRRIAEACSRGELIVDTLPEYWSRFAILLKRMEGMVAGAPNRAVAGKK